jgi:uncharacterized protein YjaG (DUF416 family)
MSILRFDEDTLVRELERMGTGARVAFAAASAERLLPAFVSYAQKASRDNSAEPGLLLERLWRVFEGEPMSPGEAQRCMERCDQLAPDDEHGWADGRSQAEDAAAALAYAFECYLSGKSQAAAWAARRVYTALDEFVIDAYDIDPSQPGAEERVLSDPLIQTELARQRRDLRELLDLGDTGSLLEVTARLRDRARSEARHLFG